MSLQTGGSQHMKNEVLMTYNSCLQSVHGFLHFYQCSNYP